MEGVCKEEVYKQIYDKVSDQLYRFLYHRFRSYDTPEDAVQEAFVRLWKNCAKVAPEKAKSFLFTVARNFTLNQIEKAKTEQRNMEIREEESVESPHEEMVGSEFEQRLHKVLDELPEKQREAFMLNKAEGYKHKEIAEMLGISQKAVEKRIYKAAATVYEKLGKKI